MSEQSIQNFFNRWQAQLDTWMEGMRGPAPEHPTVLVKGYWLKSRRNGTDLAVELDNGITLYLESRYSRRLAHKLGRSLVGRKVMVQNPMPLDTVATPDLQVKFSFNYVKEEPCVVSL